MLSRKIIPLVFVLLLFLSVAQAINVERSIDGEVKPNETIDIDLKINLEGETPSSLIVTEILPQGWTLTSSSPEATPFDGKIKWLLYGSGLSDSMSLKYTLKAPSNFANLEVIDGYWQTLEGQEAVTGEQMILEEIAPNTGDGDEPPQQEQPDYIPLIIGAVVVIVIAIIAAVVILKKKQ